jgi:putative phosphoribosyl transferase
MFADRHDAGRRLAQALLGYKEVKNGIVLALPRGGVVIGEEVSIALRLPLDVLVTRKLGAPGNPELAMGALAETGYRHLNTEVLRLYDVSSQDLEQEVRRQQQEIDRRVHRYRAGRPLADLTGGVVILVDDGIATGATFYASLAALRPMRLARLVAAVPVAPPEALHRLRSLVDDLVILQTPALFFGIGQFYSDFAQVEDEEVMACLERVRQALSASEAKRSA